MKNTEKVYTDVYNFSIIYTISAFLNTNGGAIVIGENEKGVIIGVENIDKVFGLINHNIQKYLGDFRDKISCFVDKEKNIIVINVEKIGLGIYASIHRGNRNYFYFRINGRNILSNSDDANYWEMVGKFDQPMFNDYIPFDDKDVFQNILDGNNVSLSSIGSITNIRRLYKYMDLESALMSLENKNLRFVEPVCWDDQYEGKFYNANYFDKNGGLVNNKSPFLYACCFSSKKDNEAAWSLYSHKRKGLASRCVEFSLNKKKLIYHLTKNSFNSRLFFGHVTYMSEFQIDNIHLPNIKGNINILYHKFFDNFSIKQYLNLLMVKRSAFEHEQEVRFFNVPNNQSLVKTKRDKSGKLNNTNNISSHTDIDIDWLDVIEGIRIDDSCSPYEINLLTKAIDTLINSKIKSANLNPTQIADLRNRCSIVKYNPYNNPSLSKGSLSITVN